MVFEHREPDMVYSITTSADGDADGSWDRLLSLLLRLAMCHVVTSAAACYAFAPMWYRKSGDYCLTLEDGSNDASGWTKTWQFSLVFYSGLGLGGLSAGLLIVLLCLSGESFENPCQTLRLPQHAGRLRLERRQQSQPGGKNIKKISV